MRPVTDAFLRTITGSHTMTARARVVTGFPTGTAPAGTEIPILAGEATLDATADVRSSLDLTTDGTGMWPTVVNDLLGPYGNEIFVERGVDYGNGTTEWCSLGYFRIQAPSQANPPDGPIRIEGKDRMQGIVDARLLAPAQFVSSDTYGDVADALVLEVYPTATIEWDDSSDTIAIDRALICEEQRFAFLDDLVRSLGKIWFWDYRGVLVIRDPANPADPVYEVVAGEGGVLVSASRRLSRVGVYNAVVASGEGTDTTTPARAVAIDNSTESPTYYYGPFGPVPRFYSSPFITNDTQAASAAESTLRQALGLPYNVDFSAIPNPALEPLDPVRIRYASSAGAETHVLESLTVPLTEDEALTASPREQTTVLIGTI